MRRLICQKQDIIAKMEKHGQQGVNCYQVEPGKTALLFLAQLEDLQNIIRQLTRYNDDLKKENEKHAETIKTLQTKLNML